MNTKNIFVLSVALFIVLLFVVPRAFIPMDLGDTIITVVAFLFGIIAGFYIVVTTTDYNSIKNILASETAKWVSLYQNILIYDTPTSEKLSSLIDTYIRRAFDYEVMDYERGTREEFANITKTIRGLPLKQEVAYLYEKIGNTFDDIIQTRQQLAVLGTRALQVFQWIILITLAALFIFSLYGLRTGELFFDIVTVSISSSIILVLLLIRELDLYLWNEKTFGYDIFQNVLTSIGRLPYYPIESIDKGRIIPAEKEYRVGIHGKTLTDPRTIEIRHNKTTA
jgi:hypothetical protein